ncbi:MAG: hypothetical protein KC776_38530 [Myxococcales bacterium]|nr:hypothetical protein [Myxococcales bacterium]MCB9576228.1 hypothetical protein [Polyangiaceae bacterium]
MNKPLRVAVASIAAYVVVLTWAVLYLADYAIWLHFAGPGERVGLMSTSPGQTVVYVLAAVGAALVVINGISVATRVKPVEDAAWSRPRDED